MDPPLCSGGPPPRTRLALPTTRERRLSMPEIGEKERDYLFKELYKLKSNDLMSSLRSQSPLEYPQTHSASFPPLPSPVYHISEKEIEVHGSSLPKTCGPQNTLHGCPTMKFKSLRQSSSASPFLTPPTIGHSCKLSCTFPDLLGCHSKSGQVWPCGVEPIISKLLCRLCNQGELPPSYIMG